MTEIKTQDIVYIDILKDYSSTGRLLPWRDKKMKNLLLSAAYDEIDIKKADRLRECASWLKYSELKNGSKRLTHANFCRVRLCPMCVWRRGLKIYAQTSKIMDELNKEKEYGYIFVTLTIKNVYGTRLDNAIDSMLQGWQRFIQRKRVDTVVKGWYRGLEITHNLDYKSDNFDTYHPHFHCVFAVSKSYFSGHSYISRKEWQQIWRDSMRLDYDPQVDVRKVKGNTAKAVSEVAKYAVKDSDYIIPDDWDLTIDTVRLLDDVLHKRRFVAYGKRFKELHKKLSLDDVEDGDLVHVEADQLDDETGKTIFYSWNTGYTNYINNK